ncbi:hypothetical protein [Phocoenobacter skyensis]|uniref:Uncharacterized protein n=1 Tax=Phocoenobacter skyensis TaxID=97481 RepID=A0A1H7ZJU8_9PAST|nr:hypothetical protein [Pasteurella skyensis]MDP8078936.1 hypothetical protein [Pasteurella skyensis]MDP8084886.1 hypothetical protein [Pasteurella skyensis]MDP8186061.1 hypothetical protein [Pasteurella skyensis]QLB23533.1 hypothetical protein A6B44_10120 [Pasteurella skyensis]SEM58244.1 hypothetical protein SAMN05444853_12613 [Pasteurella skyensis]
MKKLAELSKSEWYDLALAVYALSRSDTSSWKELSDDLQNTDVGKLCQRYLKTRDYKHIDMAGQLMIGKHWEIAFGRMF